MAGTNPAFNAAQFRTAIRNAMVMGQPTDVSQQVTFRWKPNKLFPTGNSDPGGNPYDWSGTPTSAVIPPDVRIPVAVEFSARPAGATDTTVGLMNPSYAELYILDEDYARINLGATPGYSLPDFVLMGGNLYEITAWFPPLGIFNVTVHHAAVQAIDES